MKQFTIKFPTSWEDVKGILTRHKSNRRKHNEDVLRDVMKHVTDVINDPYWRNDITEFMRKRITEDEGFFSAILRDHLNELK